MPERVTRMPRMPEWVTRMPRMPEWGTPVRRVPEWVTRVPRVLKQGTPARELESVTPAREEVPGPRLRSDIQRERDRRRERRSALQKTFPGGNLKDNFFRLASAVNFAPAIEK